MINTNTLNTDTPITALKNTMAIVPAAQVLEELNTLRMQNKEMLAVISRLFVENEMLRAGEEPEEMLITNMDSLILELAKS